MQPIVSDKPYQFVPPYSGRLWPRLLLQLCPWWLKKDFGVVAVRCELTERLRASLNAGHGILLAPNHCRPADPFVVGDLARQMGFLGHAMASWHVFNLGRLQKFLVQRGGAFSVYREGLDRAAVNAAIDVLAAARRPLAVFPEGTVSRTNERLNPLMEGVSLIARGAARQRAKLDPPGQVVVHPVALRYFFQGDVQQAVAPTLAEIEHRLSWQRQDDRPLRERIARAGLALLCLKEVEYHGAPQSGTIGERLARLIDHLLVPLEQQWLGEPGGDSASVVARVKKLRFAIVPELVQGDLSDQERSRRWRHLADCYLAQQLSCYPPDYLSDQPSPERLLETVERFEEDLTDRCRPYPPLVAVVRIGESIPVNPDRQRGGDDPLLVSIEKQLKTMLAQIERPASGTVAGR